jgi:diphthamide synthase (EF-2-diphthine--ammonia ligase)
LIASFDITHVAFGDLYLEDIRAYRETKMQALKIKPLFPLWGLDTEILAKDMIAAGLKAKVTCIDPGIIPASLAGRTFDEDFLNELAADIDPCGENGEFHTFVYAGPMFKQSIAIEAGEVVERENFIFADFKIPDTLRTQ